MTYDFYKRNNLNKVTQPRLSGLARNADTAPLPYTFSRIPMTFLAAAAVTIFLFPSVSTLHLSRRDIVALACCCYCSALV